MSGIKINDKARDFVSNWKTRTEKQQRKYIALTIIAYVIAFAICVGMFFWFQNRNYLRIVNQNMKYVQDSAIQEANQIEREMENGKADIINMARQYESLIKIDEKTTLEERLTIISEASMFDRIDFISPDGIDISLDGSTVVSDRNYFINGMNGEAGWELIDVSRVTGKPSVVFYSPITIDEEIIGVLVGFYEQNRLEDLFDYELFNYEPEMYLLMGDGSLVATSNDKYVYEKNILDVLSRKEFVGDTDFEKIKEVIADTERITVTFSFRDNKKTSVGVIVQFKKSDWMVLSILPYDITESMISNANSIGVILSIVIVVTFVLLSGIMFSFFRKQKGRLTQEIANATKTLNETIREEEKQLSIVQSLGNTYTGVYYVDVLENKYERIKENERDILVIPDNGAADRGFSAYVQHFVDDAYREDITEFLQINTFIPRLEQDKILSLEYQLSDKSWRRGIIVRGERDEEGVIASVIFAVQQIDHEKKKELAAQSALQEAYEAAQVASNAKTIFLSNMSHDIRTPMNAIVGMTAIAASNLDNTEKVSDCLKKITSSSKHLLGLINEVLDMSKIESGKVDLSEEEFSLSDLIENLISINQPQVKEKNHLLMVKINNLTHENVVGDSTRLQQVFTNLLSNAIKYTPENGKIEIIVTEKETNKKTVGMYEVVIKDNGIGMSEEFQKNLFEPFTRAKDDRINGIQGTGLGMPIAKNIINMMNGDITVKSEINKGSTFTVSFALKLQKDEEVNYESFVDLHVLVADDDVIACESTCNILNSLSMKSEWVTSGKEAVEKTVSHHENGDDYYAVILDWKMPNMNGVEAAREIRKQVGEEIPIIVISAYDWTDIEQEAKTAGVNAFLSKPLFKSRVVSLFNDLVGNDNNGSDNIKKELSEYDFKGRRVLLVEDNEINREMAIEFLSMVGLATDTAENGKKGVEMFESSAKGYYDLILMDIQMPVMNGYEATAAIRELSHPDAKKIPIIAMTANAFTSDIRAAYKAGMNGHVAKPIDVKYLVKVIAEYLGVK